MSSTFDIDVLQNRPRKIRMEDEDRVNIDDAWALVAMADRINEGKYIKHIEYAVDPVTGFYTNEILYRPNRELIKQSLETGVPAITADDGRRKGGARGGAIRYASVGCGSAAFPAMGCGWRKGTGSPPMHGCGRGWGSGWMRRC